MSPDSAPLPAAPTTTEPTGVARLTRDLAKAGASLSQDEARFLVDAYYQMQRDRIRAGNQMKALEKAGEPNSVLTWLEEQSRVLESQVKRALDKYTQGHPCGEWMRAQKGCGPVIAAGLLAHIDIAKAPTVGHIWRFAGLDPTVTWGKGQKRPWNAMLKTLTWKLGEAFVKVSGDPEAYYAQIYLERKAYEQERNLRGDNAAAAARILAEKRIGKETDAYAWYSGEWVRSPKYNAALAELKGAELEAAAAAQTPMPMLPPAQIHARAKRYAVKLFLSHLHEVMHEKLLGTPAPLPYPIAHLQHVHKRARP